MPNSFAYIALLAWIPISTLLFYLFRPATAAAATFVGALVLLPANLAIDLAGVPAFDRHVIGGVACLIGYLIAVPGRAQAPGTYKWMLPLFVLQALADFCSAFSNQDPLAYGPLFIRNLTTYDGVGIVFVHLFTRGLPLFLGARLVRSTADLCDVLRVIVVFGVAYIPLIIWENLMSPQLHATLYGYFPHSFAQHIRSGGFRPVGFTSHGLELALFIATALISAAGLWRANVRIAGLPGWVPFALLLVGLALCKSMGPLVLGPAIAGLILVGRTSLQVTAARLVICTILLYPVLRSLDLFPTQTIVNVAESVSGDRAESLEFRFVNENALMAKAAERPIFGWGTWGRNRVYDPVDGRDTSVTDGYWILELGMFGGVGFLLFFLYLTAPAFWASRRVYRFAPSSQRILLVTVLFIVLLRAIDLLPNAFFAPLTPFLAGALVPFGASAAGQLRRRRVPRASSQGTTTP